ncbi:uncharacterized protein [Mytilus edulis]|uniref:uncharacterized protein n=1 Tax=Mytilus edulis TaxID=6550 RepID=UPI0039EF0CE5
MAEPHLILKPRHTLVGKGLLPMILVFKSADDDVPVENLARLKKDHPLNNYSLDDLSIEFKRLTAESFKDVITLAGKGLNLKNGLQLMHKAILFPNLIGGPKGSSITTFDQVIEALKSVRALAGRPKLTPPSVLIAALEVLVECANKASHPEADFYSKALQACRQFENHDDISNLCLKLLGSSEDKNITANIAEWQKNARKNEKTDEKVESKGCNQMPIQSVSGPSAFPYPCPAFPYNPFPVGYGNPVGCGNGFPVNGPDVPPFSDSSMMRNPGFRPRFQRRTRGACFFL